MSDDFNAAISALRSWHYSEVRSVADEAIREMKETNPDDRHEWLNEWLQETIDGHNHVIYTIKAKAILLASDNEDAYVDAFGDEPSSVEARAFMAFRADVMDLLWAREDEWNCDNTGEEE